MANVRVEIHEDGLRDFLQSNKEVRDLLVSTGRQVAAEAEATASSAENGPGGTLYGYADAGFTVAWESRGRRPRVVISSNADPEMALRVHFYTQKRDGISHLRAAIRSVT